MRTASTPEGGENMSGATEGSGEKIPKYGLKAIENAEPHIIGKSIDLKINDDFAVRRLPGGSFVVGRPGKSGLMFEDEGKMMIGLGTITNKLERAAKKAGLA